MLSNYQRAIDLIRSLDDLVNFSSLCSEKTIQETEVLLELNLDKTFILTCIV